MTVEFPGRDERALAEALEAALDREAPAQRRAGARGPTDDLADLAASLRGAMLYAYRAAQRRPATEVARCSPGCPGGAKRRDQGRSCWQPRPSPWLLEDVVGGAALSEVRATAGRPRPQTRPRSRSTLTTPAATCSLSTTRQRRSVVTSNEHREGHARKGIPAAGRGGVDGRRDGGDRRAQARARRRDAARHEPGGGECQAQPRFGFDDAHRAGRRARPPTGSTQLHLPTTRPPPVTARPRRLPGTLRPPTATTAPRYAPPTTTVPTTAVPTTVNRSYAHQTAVPPPRIAHDGAHHDGAHNDGAHHDGDQRTHHERAAQA